MHDINLIPTSRYGFRDYVRFAAVSGLIITLSGFVIYFGVIDPLRRKRYAEEAFDLHTIEMQKLADVTADNNALIAKLDELRLRKEAMSELFAVRLSKKLLMQNIDGSFPYAVSMDSIEYGENAIIMQGSAPNPIGVADLSDRLKETGLFASVRILSIEREPEVELHSFVIQGRLVETE